MPVSTLYDDDILLWSEEQAALIRRLGQTRRDLPNELDVENVAEEIESLGRSELASVESQIQNILVHLIKLAAESDSDASADLQIEIVSFHADMRRRYAPSMRQRIDMQQLCRLSRKLAVLATRGDPGLAGRLPSEPPFYLEEILEDDIEPLKLADRLRRSQTSERA